MSRRKKAASEKYFTITPPDDTNQKYFVGKFLIGTCNCVLPTDSVTCRARINYFSMDVLVLKFEDDLMVPVNLLADSQLVLRIISTKVFSIKFAQDGENVEIMLYFTRLPIENFTVQAGRTVKEAFQVIFEMHEGFTFQDDNVSSVHKRVENVYDVYQKIRTLQRPEDLPAINVQSVHLKPTLRPYQEDAVRWMIHRETKGEPTEHNHPAYSPITLPSGISIYFDKHTGHVEPKRPTVVNLPTGGILADEMGLGKTVEVLACILYNKVNTEMNEPKTEAEEIPVVVKKGRKRPPEVLEPEAAKKLKLAPAKPVHYRVALNKWYADTLQSVNKRSSVKKTESYIQCVCGQNVDNLLVVCGDCGKRQHSTCMGFEGLDGDYLCPQCWKSKPLLESNATLIVCPMTLVEQWSNEICKHVKSGLSVLQYEGTNTSTVYPTELQRYDLVITTYGILQAELWQAEFNQGKSLRAQSRYASPGCPLMLIKWRRLCFDEAQLMESGIRISEMASKLTSDHRWAITGTPVSKGLADLYSLIDFLRLEPYSIESTWKSVLYDPYLSGDSYPMLDFLSKILWRTAKADVLDQINIPAQVIKEYTHEFTDVERYFYDKEHDLSRYEFLKNLVKFRMDIPLMSLNKSELKQILAPVLALRQACAHHNVVKGRYLLTKKSVNSMEELLDALIAKNISECEDNLRLLVASFNGAAGIYILLNKLVQAVECYRKVLQLSAQYTEENSGEVKLGVDKLQLIHAMHNLAEVIAGHPDLRIDNTLRDASLKEDCLELENKYMGKFAELTTEAIKINTKHADDVNNLQDQLELKEGQWYSAILDYVAAHSLIHELETKINGVLNNNGYQKSLVNVNEKRIFYMVNVKEGEVLYLREKTITAVNDLYTICDGKILVSPDLVQSAADCHLRPTATSTRKKRCAICQTNSVLKEYESKLFFMTKQTQEERANMGNWKPSIEEQIMKAILTIAKSKNMDRPLIHDGEITVAIFDIFKKEFKEIRKLWTCIDRQICASDEVDMCKLRMSLKVDQEKTAENKDLKQLSYTIDNPHATINQLKWHELEYHISKIKTEEITYSRQLEKCIGMHKYLQTLHKRQDSGQALDPCPICKNELDNKWNTLKCGHCYCIDCVRMLLERAYGSSIQCSVCREKQDISEINYVVNKDQPTNEDDVKIKGNCSSRVEAITKLVKQLQAEDENVKMLVFSNWVDVLKVIKSVFDLNNIRSEIVTSQQNQNRLKLFQSASKNVTVLLLPIKLGSKGLNIIEATNVIFVEPLLDPADELQAIGRVHRIGQTKPTVVHKFLMKNTIEEEIHAATSLNASDWDKNRVTLQQIKQLFFKDATLENGITVEDTN